MNQPLSMIDSTQFPQSPHVAEAEQNLLHLFPDVYLFETKDGRFQLRTPRSKGSLLHLILCEDSERSPYLWVLAIDTLATPELRHQAYTTASQHLSDESNTAVYFRAIGDTRGVPLGTMTDDLNRALALLTRMQTPSIPALLRAKGYEYEAGLIQTVVTLYDEARRT